MPVAVLYRPLLGNPPMPGTWSTATPCHRSHELDPDDATALAAWKQALAAEAWAADKLGEAIRLQSEAVHFDNTDSVSWYFLALYYEEAGQTQAAIDAIREAVELEPDDAEYRELLAELQNPGPMILE